MITTTVSTNGRIVIPSLIRRRLDIKPGTRIFITEGKNQIILQPLTRGYFDKKAGVLNTKGKLTRAILEERAKDKRI